MVATLDQVLANVQPGRVAYLFLEPQQKRLLRDRDGQLALHVLRHLLGARDHASSPDKFPLTEEAVQRVAGRLGLRVGQKHCRRLIRRLRDAKVIVFAGSYRQMYRCSAARSGFRVPLFLLGAKLRSRFAHQQRAVGKRRPRKRVETVRWWQHPLFGDYQGLPPPQFTGARRKKSRSLDEVFQDIGTAFARNPEDVGA